MKPMILSNEQQISFISMCNDTMNNSYEDKKTKGYKEVSTEEQTEPSRLSRKQIITIDKSEERKEENSMESEPENYNSENDTDTDERGKDEDNKTNPLSKLFNKLSNKLIKKDEGQIKSKDSADKQQGQILEESEKETNGQQRQTNEEKKRKTNKKK